MEIEALKLSKFKSYSKGEKKPDKIGSTSASGLYTSPNKLR